MKLKFKYQKFQQDAVESVCNVFNGQPCVERKYLADQGKVNGQVSAGQQGFDIPTDGWGNADINLSDRELLDNINEVPKRWQLSRDFRLNKLNDQLALTVEMETGTGKTYVYINTILELHKRYGWSKFIVVVPSIAIREGVLKTFQITADHFKQQYGTSCQYFVYNSSRLQDVSAFERDNHVEVMIVNSQAFNARGADARRMFMQIDDLSMRGRRPIDVVAATRPIVIIDEPQSVLGDAKKKNATREQLKKFKPLFYLLYSATHRENFNMVYRLDAVDAYKQKLVKKITVKGVSLTGNTASGGYLYLDRINTFKDKNPTATVVIEYDAADGSGHITKRTKQLSVGDNIYDYSGGIESYRYGYTITDIDASAGADNGIVRFMGNFELSPGQCRGDVNADDMRRIQIDETIKSHLEREQDLFYRGVKVLSLFFIDEVAKYKQYDDMGKEQPGLYAKVFEVEYRRQVENKLKSMSPDESPEWQEYLRKSLNTVNKIHAGYFSVDKKGHVIDSKVGRGRDESDDESAYDLIMKDKERLLSFDEPVRFIFSHSALREGWDNPNVFQICTLRESSSSIKKRQEIGRGLRLAVNKYGERLDEEMLGNDVQNVNTLTVVANESYDSFARALQDEMQEIINSRPLRVDIGLFKNQILVALDKSNPISDEDASMIYSGLRNSGLVDKDGNLSDEYRDMVQDEKITAVTNAVGGDYSPAAVEIVELLDSVYDPKRDKMITNARNSVQLKLRRDKIMSADFQQFWNEIDRKTYYQVDFDEDELVKRCVERLNGDGVKVSVLEAVVKKGDVEVEEHSTSMVRESSWTRNILPNVSHVKYDLIGEVASQTNLLRRTVCEILTSIRPTVFANYRKNPEEFIRRVIRLIEDVKAPMISENIHYYVTDKRWDVNEVFDQTITGHIGEDVLEVSKNVYDRLKYDSKVEKQLAEAMERDSEIETYAKIPTSFKITTPVGNYSPDWAVIAKKTDGTRKVFFVAESKGSDEEKDLKGVENAKISCARQHFAVVSNGRVKYGVATDINDLRLNLFSD